MKQLTTNGWFVVMLVLCIFSLQAKAQKPTIHNFEVLNGRISFDATATNNPNDSTQGTNLPLDEFSLGVLNERPIPLEAVPNVAKDTQKVSGILPAGVFPGKRLFTIFYQGDSLTEDIYPVESQLTGPGQQPIIESITPHGTSPGKMVTIEGKGFGDNLNDIYIWFTTPDDTQLPMNFSQVINPATVTYLTTPDANGLQQLKFIVAGETSAGKLLQESPQNWLETELRMRVVVKGQPSANSEILSIVASSYRTKLILMVLGIFIGFSLLIWVLYKYYRRRGSKNPLNLRSLVVDQTTNRLSLAKVQALAWTTVLAISYTYYILMTFLILDQSVIPDFDASLLVLMGISTSGLLIARSQDKSSQQKMEAAGTLTTVDSPSVWDLVSENGTINLASLQLVVFTAIGIGVYIVYMTSPDLVETGLPTMPDTLLALMGISQGGYITGKSVEGGSAEPSTSNDNPTGGDNGHSQPTTNQVVAAPQQVTPAPEVSTPAVETAVATNTSQSTLANPPAESNVAATTTTDAPKTETVTPPTQENPPGDPPTAT